MFTAGGRVPHTATAEARSAEAGYLDGGGGTEGTRASAAPKAARTRCAKAWHKDATKGGRWVPDPSGLALLRVCARSRAESAAP